MDSIIDGYAIKTISVSPNGNWIATHAHGNGILLIWKIVAGKPEMRWWVNAEETQANHLAVNNDGTNAAIRYDDNSCSIFENKHGSQNGSIVRTLKNLHGNSGDITFLPDGRLAILNPWSFEIYSQPFDDIKKKVHIFEFPQNLPHWDEDKQPLHRGLVYRRERNGFVSLWSINDGQLIRFLKVDEDVTNLAVSSSGRYLAAQIGKRVRILDMCSGFTMDEFELNIESIRAFDINKPIFFDFTSEDRYLRIWLRATGTSNSNIFASFDYNMTSNHLSRMRVKPFNGININRYSCIGTTSCGDGKLIIQIGESTKLSIYEVNRPFRYDKSTPTLPQDGPYCFDALFLQPWSNGIGKCGCTHSSFNHGKYWVLNNKKHVLIATATCVQLWSTRFEEDSDEDNDLLDDLENSLEKLLYISCSPITHKDPEATFQSLRTANAKLMLDQGTCVIQADFFTGMTDGMGTEIIETVFTPLSESVSSKISSKVRDSDVIDRWDRELMAQAWTSLVIYCNKQVKFTEAPVSIYDDDNDRDDCARCVTERSRKESEKRDESAKIKCDLRNVGSNQPCTRCRKSKRYCPRFPHYFIFDQLYNLVSEGIKHSKTDFARITGAYFYEPVFDRNLDQFLWFIKNRESLLMPLSLFDKENSMTNMCKPFKDAILDRETNLVQTLYKFMCQRSLDKTEDPKTDDHKTYYMKPITICLPDLCYIYPNFVVDITKQMSFLSVSDSEPFLPSDRLIKPGMKSGSAREELYGESVVPMPLKHSQKSGQSLDKIRKTKIEAKSKSKESTDEQSPKRQNRHRQEPRNTGIRPAILCTIPFEGLCEDVDFIYTSNLGWTMKKKKSIFAELALLNGSEFFGEPVTEALIKFKWRTFVRNRWRLVLILHFIFYILYITTIVHKKLYQTVPQVRVGLIIIYMILGIIFLAVEIRQIRWTGYKKYFISFYNHLDIFTYTVPIVAGILELYTTYKPGAKSYWPTEAMACSTFLIWLHFLVQLRVLELGLPFIILIEIGKTVRPYLILLLIIIVSFSEINYTLLGGIPSDPTNSTLVNIYNNATFAQSLGTSPSLSDLQNHYQTPWDAAMLQFFELWGDFNSIEVFSQAYPDSFAPVSLSIFMTILYSFITSVVLLNVLIAIMTGTTEVTLLVARRLWIQMVAQVVAEIETVWRFPFDRTINSDPIYYEASTDVVSKWERSIKEEPERSDGVFKVWTTLVS